MVKRHIYIIILVICNLWVNASNKTKLDSIEQLVISSEGTEHCWQVVNLHRAFENQKDAGSIPFPDSYYKYVFECIQLADSINNIELLNALKISKAALIIREGKNLQVINLISEVLATRQALSLSDSLDAYVFLSNAYHSLGLDNKALELAPVKMLIAKRLGRNDVINELDSEIASTYYRLKVFDLAALHFRKLVNNYIGEKNWRLVAGHYSNLGLCYNGLEKPDSALFYYNLAKKYVYRHFEDNDNEIEKNYFLGFLDGNCAEVYINLGTLNKGVELAIRDIKNSKKFGDFDNVVSRQLLIAKAYRLLNEPLIALAYLDSASNLMSRKGLVNQKTQIRIGDLKAHILFEMKDYKRAATLFNEINVLRDSLQIKENELNALISNSVFQLYQKENELNKQKADLAEVKALHFKEVQWRYILFMVAIGLMVFIILGYIGLKQKNIANKLLANQKLEIESQKKQIEKNLEEKEILLKEIQHRVKNNLQVISGMLQLQAGASNNKEVVAIMQEGNNRIKSMALIHQQLYHKSADLKHISLQEYLNKLITQIAGSYKTTSKNVAIDIDALDIQLDVSTAIPLGLIINELVSNAFKYAFIGKKDECLGLSVKRETENQFILRVEDNGVGLAKDFNLNKINSLGLKLVKILSKQLNGSIQIVSNVGTCFIITFKDNIAV